MVYYYPIPGTIDGSMVLLPSFGFQPDACCCYALAKCEAGEMAIDFKGRHYPKSVILYAVYPYIAMQFPTGILKRSWQNGTLMLTMPR